MGCHDCADSYCARTGLWPEFVWCEVRSVMGPAGLTIDAWAQAGDRLPNAMPGQLLTVLQFGQFNRNSAQA